MPTTHSLQRGSQKKKLYSHNAMVSSSVFFFFFFFFFFSSTFRLVESYFPNQRSNLTLAVKAWSPNHWPAREFPALSPLLNRTEFLLGASSDSSTLTRSS